MDLKLAGEENAAAPFLHFPPRGAMGGSDCWQLSEVKAVILCLLQLVMKGQVVLFPVGFSVGKLRYFS